MGDGEGLVDIWEYVAESGIPKGSKIKVKKTS